MDNYASQLLIQGENEPVVTQQVQMICPLQLPFNYVGSNLPVKFQSPDGSIIEFIPILQPIEEEGMQPEIPGVEQGISSGSILQACEPAELQTWNSDGAMVEPMIPGPCALYMQFQPQPVNSFELMHVIKDTEQCIINISVPAPSNETELFIGKLPHENTVDQIYSVFAQIGPVYQARLKYNFSGQSKGYGFIQYYNEQDEARAITELNCFKFDPSAQTGINVQTSINNKRIFVCMIPKDLNAQGICEAIICHPKMLGLVRVECPMHNHQSISQNRGYCFLEFGKHLDAMLALKAMLQDPKMIFTGYTISAKWAKKCTYDTTSRSNVTIGGHPSLYEMCTAWFWHYPKSLVYCDTSAKPDLNKLFGIQNYTWNGESYKEPILTEPVELAGMKYSAYLNTLNWTQELKDQVQTELQFGPHETICLGYPLRTVSYPQINKEYVEENACELTTGSSTETYSSSTEKDENNSVAVGKSFSYFTIVTAFLLTVSASLSKA